MRSNSVFRSQFGIKLENLKHNRCMTNKIISEKVGVRENTISEWINGQASPRSENLVELCKLFGVTADWLLGMTS